MSELAPGSVSLEDDNPSLESLSQPPAPVETPPEPQQAAQEATEQPETEPEGTVVNPNGEKLVPLGAVRDLRGKVQATKAELDAAKAELETLRGKVKTADAIAEEWQRLQPIINQAKQQPQPQQAPPPPAAGPLTEQEAVEYAKDLDLYKADGTPDVARAQRLAARNEALADRRAQTAMAPLYQHTQQQQSQVLFEQAAAHKGVNGQTVDRGVLWSLWSQLPAEMTARPEVAQAVHRMAMGEMVLQGKVKPTITAPPPPVVTESVGGGGNTPRELTAVDRNMMQAVGMKPKEYEDISARFKPGERNSLE